MKVTVSEALAMLEAQAKADPDVSKDTVFILRAIALLVQAL